MRSNACLLTPKATLVQGMAYVLCAASSALIVHAADTPGDEWEAVLGAPAVGRPVFGNDRFVAWDGTGAGKSYVSDDGAVWTAFSHSWAQDDGLVFGSGLFLHYNPGQFPPPGEMLISEDGERWDSATGAEFVGVVWAWRDRFWALQLVEGHPPEEPDEWAIVGSRVLSSPDGRTWQGNNVLVPFWKADQDAFVTGGGRTLGTALESTKGEDALVLTEDGRDWSLLTDGETGVRSYLGRGLAYGNGTYVWLAKPQQPESNQQIVFTSTNGMDWSPQAAPTTNELLGIAYGNKTFVAAGDDGTLLTSPDGTNWTTRPSGTSATLSHAVFGGGRFVLTGGAVVRSALQPQAVEEIRFMPRLCRRLSDGTMLLTVEGSYGQPVVVEGSDDMQSWEEIVTDPCDRGEFEVYDEVAVDLPRRFYRAHPASPEPPPDPLTQWTMVDSVLENGESLDWKLAYGNGVLVAVGKKENASGSAWYSEDGLSWQPSNSSEPHENVAFGPGRFVSWAGATPMSTVEGQDWIAHDVVEDGLDAGGMAYGRGRFVALADPVDGYDLGYMAFLSSADGSQWQEERIPDFYAGIGGGMLLFAKGRMVYLDYFQIISSADGLHWDRGVTFGWDLTPKLDHVFYGGGRFMATGVSLYTSEDGVKWTERGAVRSGKGIHANGNFLGASQSGSTGGTKLSGSPDGVTWTNLVRLETSSIPSDLLFAKGRFYVVTREGEVFHSGLMRPHVTEPRVIPELTYRLPDGAMLVTVEAPYGHEVVVEGSEDLETWQEVGRDPCDRGEFEVYHETAPPGTDWFYRARQLEP